MLSLDSYDKWKYLTKHHTKSNGLVFDKVIKESKINNASQVKIGRFYLKFFEGSKTQIIYPVGCIPVMQENSVNKDRRFSLSYMP